MSHAMTGYAEARTRLLTKREVATVLGMSTRSVDRLVERGELRRVRIGGAARFLPSDVDGLIERGVS